MRQGLADRGLGMRCVRTGREEDREVVGACIAAHAAIVLDGNEDRAPGAREIANDAGHAHRHEFPRDGNLDAFTGFQSIKVARRLRGPHGNRVATRRHPARLGLEAGEHSRIDGTRDEGERGGTGLAFDHGPPGAVMAGPGEGRRNSRSIVAPVPLEHKGW